MECTVYDVLHSHYCIGFSSLSFALRFPISTKHLFAKLYGIQYVNYKAMSGKQRIAVFLEFGPKT